MRTLERALTADSWFSMLPLMSILQWLVMLPTKGIDTLLGAVNLLFVAVSACSST